MAEMGSVILSFLAYVGFCKWKYGLAESVVKIQEYWQNGGAFSAYLLGQQWLKAR